MRSSVVDSETDLPTGAVGIIEGLPPGSEVFGGNDSLFVAVAAEAVSMPVTTSPDGCVIQSLPFSVEVGILSRHRGSDGRVIHEVEGDLTVLCVCVVSIKTQCP